MWSWYDAEVYVTLDKPAFVAGEVVHGRVTISLLRDIVAEGLSVRIRGHERVSWTKLEHEDHRHSGSRGRGKKYTRTNAFLDDSVPLFHFPRALAKGRHEFVFAYQSHASLPGTFTFDPATRDGGHEGWSNHESSHKRARSKMCELRVSISYSVRAKLDWGWRLDFLNARGESDLVVHELPRSDVETHRDAGLRGTFDAASQSVRLLSLLHQGMCDVSARLTQPTYSPGDVAAVLFRIKNESAIDVGVLKAALYQDIELQHKTNADLKRLSTCVASVACPGVSAHSEVESALTLALTNSASSSGLPPTTTGALVRCSYRLRLECDTAWSPDVYLELPITIAPRLAAQSLIAPFATPMPLAVGALVEESTPVAGAVHVVEAVDASLPPVKPTQA